MFEKTLEYSSLLGKEWLSQSITLYWTFFFSLYQGYFNTVQMLLDKAVRNESSKFKWYEPKNAEQLSVERERDWEYEVEDNFDSITPVILAIIKT